MPEMPLPGDWISERVIASAYLTDDSVEGAEDTAIVLTLRPQREVHVNYAISTYRLRDGLMLTLGEFENIHDAVEFFKNEGGE